MLRARVTWRASAGSAAGAGLPAGPRGPEGAGETVGEAAGGGVGDVEVEPGDTADGAAHAVLERGGELDRVRLAWPVPHGLVWGLGGLVAEAVPCAGQPDPGVERLGVLLGPVPHSGRPVLRVQHDG